MAPRLVRPSLVLARLEKAGLTGDECRLVSGFRGLPAPQQAAFLTILAMVVLDEAEDVGKSAHAQNLTGQQPYRWRCDEARVTKKGA